MFVWPLESTLLHYTNKNDISPLFRTSGVPMGATSSALTPASISEGVHISILISVGPPCMYGAADADRMLIILIVDTVEAALN